MATTEGQHESIRVHANIGRQAITNIEICEVSLNNVFFILDMISQNYNLRFLSLCCYAAVCSIQMFYYFVFEN